MNTFDNITAPASALGGAVTVIRISGPDALEIANKVWHGNVPLSSLNRRKMLLGTAGNDQSLAVYMQAPNSYTGDDVVELQCHGGAAAANSVLSALLDAGCRMAEPGEFTFRAFANGKLDLVQAEAVADIISAGSELAYRTAEKQLAGSLSKKLQTIRKELVDLRAESESHLDFPDEELAWDEHVSDRIRAVMAQIGELLRTATFGQSLREGVRLALAGRPNAGKSSLLNALLGYDRAIVTDIAGTTRDTLEEQTSLRNIPVRITDTAGLRESDDLVEQLGVERSRRSIAASEITFYLLDASAPDLAAEVEQMQNTPVPNRIAVWNKCDLAVDRELPELETSVRISAKTGEGLEELLDAFVTVLSGSDSVAETEVAVNARHRKELEKALAELPEAIERFEDGEYELASPHLRAAADAIGNITGETVSPDILDNIFSRFCIGK
ncbi:MAG: tRNA uridine-5-carboxymethylaminomethyl(34) synthesis GTPase MnmE [Lentisphaeria bacterium]|nr:tRNA uridine-5-carboxymethylaminomethyl(34) synthesis GTPase MnmE [Lentisphaeria bacterium]